MNSKVLTSEHKVDFGGSTVLFYGTQNEQTSNIVSMTVKGKFKPTKKLPDYKTNIKTVKDGFTKHVSTIIRDTEWVSEFYILTTDFTECGIVNNKSSKWKFNLFVTPKSARRLDGHRAEIVKLGKRLVKTLQTHMEDNSFCLSV